MIRVLISMILLGVSFSVASAWAFDHQHRAWDQLLKKQVVWIENGTASRVSYTGIQQDHAQLTSYLDSLSAVRQGEFTTWTKHQQLAFLINVYNAFTIELILTEYPAINSIKDLGSLFTSPWKKRFFTLLERPRHLDEIEHDLIRKEGVYDEPRIHVALVCASIGCPALRDEAFTAFTLDDQLEDSFIRFLSDKSRNRYNPMSQTLEVSRIFSWYKRDFSSGYQGFGSLEAVFARYAHLLADTPQQQQRLQERKAEIVYLDYDWHLNDALPTITAMVDEE